MACEKVAKDLTCNQTLAQNSGYYSFKKNVQYKLDHFWRWTDDDLEDTCKGVIIPKKCETIPACIYIRSRMYRLS